MNAGQLSRLRSWATRQIERAFPVDIVVSGHSIPAARFKLVTGGSSELSGLMADCDASWRIRREVIPTGVAIVPERTIVVEGGKSYRVSKVHDSVGDPALVVEGKEA